MKWKKNVLINLQLSRAVKLIKVEIEMLTFALQNSDAILKYEKMDKPSVKQVDTLWTGTIIEFVELFYGTLELAKFNKGEIRTKELIDSLCVKFGFEVKDCYGAYLDMRKRTGKSRTLFLDRMSKALNERMKRDDEREHSRTKGK